MLHGDIHHENILDFGPRGWLAIDPKRLHGERGFDFANILRDPTPAMRSRPAVSRRQAHVIAQAARARSHAPAPNGRWHLRACRQCGS